MNLSESCYSQRSRTGRLILSLLFISLFSVILNGQDQQTFSIGAVEAKSGEKVSGSLIVEDGADKGTFIPFTIIKGTNSGPVLTLVAGIHGTEYVPVIALQQLVKEINPDSLSGTLVMVHIANMPAFTNRKAYRNQADNKNLNRIFPGRKDGTLTERIARTLTEEIIKKSDYYVDLHGGEFNEHVVDFLYFYYGCPDQELNDRSKMMAHALGNRYLIPFDYSSVPDSLPSEFSDTEALRHGVAAVTLEWGDRGIVLPGETDIARGGIINLMKAIGMLQGAPFVNEHPVYIVNENTINSNYDGILYTMAEKGQYVSRGALIGYTTDYWGRTLEKYYSPITGIVLAVKVSPAINKGEAVFKVAEPQDEYIE